MFSGENAYFKNPRGRDRDGSSGGASTSSVDSTGSGTTTSTGKRDSIGSQSTAPSRKSSTKVVKSPEKEGARQLARSFFSRSGKATSRSSTPVPTIQAVDEKELVGSLERVNSLSSTKSSKRTLAAIRNGITGHSAGSVGTRLQESPRIEEKSNLRVSPKTVISVDTRISSQLNESELRQRLLQASKDVSPLSPTSTSLSSPVPTIRKEIPLAPKAPPIVQRKPLGPRQIADWDIDPVATIEEEDELLDGLSWIDTDTGSKRVSSNDTLSEPFTIDSHKSSPNSSTEEIPLILDQSCLSPEQGFRLEYLPRIDTVPIVLDLKNIPRSVPTSPAINDDIRSQPMSPTSPTSPFSSPFLDTLHQMEIAGLEAIYQKLNMSTENLDESAQNTEAFFEKRLWALMACQWLTFGKQLQSPGHEILLNSRLEDGKKLLHLHGPAADGWVFAAKYPRATIYSVSSQNVTNPAKTYTMPSNHHHLFTPAVSSPIPFPDNYFDVVVTRTLSSVLKSDELESVLQESLRILRPGGWLELHTIDPTLTRAGDITKKWIESRVLAPMENDFYSAKPSDRILNLLNELGYSRVKSARIALPTLASSTARTVTTATGISGNLDAQKVMASLGKHFYEELYEQFLKAGHIGEGSPTWWWNSKLVMQECERENTCFGLTISFGRKPR